MTQKVVTYITCEDLHCGNLPQEVVMCVPFEKVRIRECPETEEPEGVQFDFVMGSLISKRCVGCGTLAEFQYLIEYDDEQLIDNYELLGGDVLGLSCLTCSDKAAIQLAGAPCYIYTDDDDNVIFVNQFGCQYTIIEGGG